MPLCPSCKTFYVEDPCPNCENSKNNSVHSNEQGEGENNQEDKTPKTSRATEEGLVDFFGSVSTTDDIDIITGRRKTKETLVSTPWHREREIRSINQRKVGEKHVTKVSTDKQSGMKASPSEMERKNTTTTVKSSMPATTRRPLIDKSLFNPIDPTTSPQIPKKDSISSINDDNFLAYTPPRVPDQRLPPQSKVELPKITETGPQSVPPSISSQEKEDLLENTPPIKDEASSPPIVPMNNNQGRSAPHPISTRDHSNLDVQEPEIPKWLLADKSSQSPSVLSTSRPMRSSNSQSDQLQHASTSQQGIQSSSSSDKVAKKPRKKGILGFLRRKLSRGGETGATDTVVAVEKVDLSATHVKAGGLTLPRWIVGEKVEDSPTKSSSQVVQVQETKDIRTTSVSTSESTSPHLDRGSPQVIDETLLELERKFKDNMPQMPTMSTTENLAESLREDMVQDSPNSVVQPGPSEANAETDLSASSFDEFDEFDLEELAAQVIAQLDAPDIRETEHRLDPQSLDMLESLAAEFLKETTGKEDIVRTEVVRHDSVTSLALDPKYSQELKEVPGFDENNEKIESRGMSQATSQSLTSSKQGSAIPLRRPRTTGTVRSSTVGMASTRNVPSSETSSPPTMDVTFRRSNVNVKESTIVTDSPVDFSNRPVVIAVEDLVKTYKLESGKEHRVLLGIQMEIYQGEWVAIVGPSGSGKSTLLNILGGLDNPTVGSVYILDKDITKMSDRELSQYRLKTVGFVFQFFNLVPELTAVENIEFPQRLLGVDRKKARERAEELLDWIGLWEVKDQRVDLLSGGEQQRVAICVALANDPPIILMDEPTGNLDKANTDLVMDIFESLNRDFGKTLVCVTHDLEVAARSHRVFSLVNGKLIEGKAIVD